jgi:magnesium chelatase family protein
MTEDTDTSTISSKEMYQKVLIAFQKQVKRGFFNSRLPQGYKFDIEEDAKEILEMAIDRFNLSKRSEFKILKVAQTIADLENYDKINKKAVLEALNYRRRQ